MLAPEAALEIEHPQTAEACRALGHRLREERRHEDALAAFDRALALAPQMIEAAVDRADELQVLGRNEDAIAAYRMVLSADPLQHHSHRQLNHLLYRIGDDANFLRSYDEAFAKLPNRPGLPLAKAGFLLQTDRLDDAAAAFEIALRLMPDAIAPINGLAATLARKGEYARAIALHERAVKLAPQHVDTWNIYCETLLRAGEAAKAHAAAETAMPIAPLDQGLIAMHSLAMRAAGDARDEWLNDFDNLIQSFELEPPAGFHDMAAFNESLNTALDARHTGKREFLSQSLRGGTQTVNDLFSDADALVDAIRGRIHEAVAKYIARLDADDQHPLRKRKHNDFAYSASWSSRLHDCGFHVNHVHPKGWISSVYYVAVPDAVEDDVAKQGWLKFGEPGFDAHIANPIRRAVKPKPGTLVLFPSYMWHGTVPFHSSQDRTTIAFDVVPK